MLKRKFVDVELSEALVPSNIHYVSLDTEESSLEPTALDLS